MYMHIESCLDSVTTSLSLMGARGEDRSGSLRPSTLEGDNCIQFEGFKNLKDASR
jgi:hypothetical protein